MAGQKELLYDSILQEDWGGVRKFYKYLYSEEVPLIEEGGSTTRSTGRIKSKKTKEKQGGSKKKDSNQIVTKIDTKQRRMPANKVAKNTKLITFNTAEDALPGYKKALKAHAKVSKQNKENRRDPYKPDLRNCAACGNAFDFQAEYPSGLLDSEIEKELCYKCKTKK